MNETKKKQSEFRKNSSPATMEAANEPHTYDEMGFMVTFGGEECDYREAHALLSSDAHNSVPLSAFKRLNISAGSPADTNIQVSPNPPDESKSDSTNREQVICFLVDFLETHLTELLSTVGSEATLFSPGGLRAVVEQWVADTPDVAIASVSCGLFNSLTRAVLAAFTDKSQLVRVAVQHGFTDLIPMFILRDAQGALLHPAGGTHRHAHSLSLSPAANEWLWLIKGDGDVTDHVWAAIEASRLLCSPRSGAYKDHTLVCDFLRGCRQSGAKVACDHVFADICCYIRAAAASPLHLDALKCLIEAGGDVNGARHPGEPPVHVALSNRSALEYLLDHGADVGARSCAGKTLMDAAGVNMELGRLLLSHGAEATKRFTRAQAKAAEKELKLASLFISELHRDVTEDTLTAHFSQAGSVLSARVCCDKASGASLGCGYVNFAHRADAERALQVLNYTEILGRACHVAWSQRDADKRHNTGLNVYVKGLPAGTDARRLHAEFMRFGAIASVKVGKNASGEALPYGFVHFQDEEAGNEAIAAAAAPEGLKIDDCAVHVEVHKPNTGKNVEDDTNFTSVFVKNIPAAWAAEDLERRLAEFGAVSSATLLPRAAGRSCGFVYFVEHAAAAAAVAALPETPESKGVAGADAAVAELQCCRALSKAEVAAAKQAALEAKKMQRQVSNLGSNLYIKFLPENMTKDMLEAAFSPFGTVSSAKLVTDMAGEGTGVGYVCFSSPADATKALVAMQGAQLDPANPARKLYVALHIPKTLRVSPHRAQQQQHWKVHGRRAGRGRGLQTVQRPIPPIVYPYPQPPAPMPVPYPGHPHQHQQHQPGFGALAGMGIDAGAAADTGARSTEEERLRRIIASLASQLAAGSQK